MAVAQIVVRQAFRDVRPEVGSYVRQLERDIVLRERGAYLRERRDAEDAVADAVGRHKHAVQIRVFRYPLELGYAADVGRIRADYVDRPVFDQVHEVLAQEDLLAGMDWRRRARRYVPVGFCHRIGRVVPRQRVFEPHDVQRLDRLRYADYVDGRIAGAHVEREADPVPHHLHDALDVAHGRLERGFRKQAPAVQERARVHLRGVCVVRVVFAVKIEGMPAERRLHDCEPFRKLI